MTFPIVVLGHVDHGKSTLIGRLLHDTGQLRADQIERAKASSKARGRPVEWAFVLDALQLERDQGITLDASHIRFRTAARDYAIIDAPGHRELIANMMTAAAAAEAALLLVDAEAGLGEQTRRHAALLALLGIGQVAVLINKVDRVGFDRERIDAVAREVGEELLAHGVTAAAILPISARDGDNVASRSANLAWYDGPTLLEALDGFTAQPRPTALPLRLPIQDIYRRDDRRLPVGRIESGTLAVGDEIVIAPGHRASRIATIESWPGPAPSTAEAGQSVALTLTDDLFVAPGDLLHGPGDPPIDCRRLTMRLCWVGDAPPAIGQTLELRLGTGRHAVQVTEVATADAADEQALIVTLGLEAQRPFACDRFAALTRTGRGVLLAGGQFVAAGIVTDAISLAAAVEPSVPSNLVPARSHIGRAERARAAGHDGMVLWLTGLPGSGKSTLGLALERRLFDAGWRVTLLDGDALRTGLGKGLGFSREDRAENVRRAAETARLMSEAGLVVIVALISPFRSDREAARAIVGDRLREIYVEADLAVCEARDPKGLYAQARLGKVVGMTGLDAPYEAPLAADLTIPTGQLPLDTCIDRLERYVEFVGAL